MVGVQCILLGGILFPKIYWQTACLLQRSGALDDKSADYNKIAKAVSSISKQNVKIMPLDINKSEYEFSIDEENNTIHFGFSGIKGLKSKVIDKIFETRPYESMSDFIVKTGADVGSIVTLIKAGAFDNFGSRRSHIELLSKFKSDQKEKLNGQNLTMLASKNYWPTNTEKLKEALKCFNFTKYLKIIAKEHEYESEELKKTHYYLDERAKDYLDRIEYEYNGDYLIKAAWKSYYDLMMEPIKAYMVEHQDELLQKVNEGVVQEWREKYFPSEQGESQWEIETMGLCFGEHPMTNLNGEVAIFEDLPTQPEIKNFAQIKGRQIPLYKLSMLAGIVIAKDKLHSSITLLTPTGPVEVKFRKEQFASYDCQISKTVDGKKKVIEKSWFNRGVGLLVHGMRQDDLFIAKTYKNSPMKHSAYKIIKILPTGKVSVQKERAIGNKEESQDE